MKGYLDVMSRGGEKIRNGFDSGQLELFVGIKETYPVFILEYSLTKGIIRTGLILTR